MKILVTVHYDRGQAFPWRVMSGRVLDGYQDRNINQTRHATKAEALSLKAEIEARYKEYYCECMANSCAQV